MEINIVLLLIVFSLGMLSSGIPLAYMNLKLKNDLKYAANLVKQMAVTGFMKGFEEYVKEKASASEAEASKTKSGNATQ